MFTLQVNTVKDIDQLKKTMQLTGTPGPTLLAKITSEEVVDDVIFSLQHSVCGRKYPLKFFAIFFKQSLGILRCDLICLLPVYNHMAVS